MGWIKLILEKIKICNSNNYEIYNNIICKHKIDIIKYKYISDEEFSLNGGWVKFEEIIKGIINIINGRNARNN